MDTTPSRKRTFKHLTWEKRLQIEALYRIGYKAPAIAKEIGCTFKTVYIEVNRGTYEHKESYWDCYAEKK